RTATCRTACPPTTGAATCTTSACAPPTSAPGSTSPWPATTSTATTPTTSPTPAACATSTAAPTSSPASCARGASPSTTPTTARSYLTALFDATLVNNNQYRGATDYNYADTYEYMSKEYALLPLHADHPSDIEYPARVLFSPTDGQGRKTEFDLAGGDRDVLW